MFPILKLYQTGINQITVLMQAPAAVFTCAWTQTIQLNGGAIIPLTYPTGIYIFNDVDGVIAGVNTVDVVADCPVGPLHITDSATIDIVNVNQSLFGVNTELFNSVNVLESITIDVFNVANYLESITILSEPNIVDIVGVDCMSNPINLDTLVVTELRENVNIPLSEILMSPAVYFTYDNLYLLNDNGTPLDVSDDIAVPRVFMFSYTGDRVITGYNTFTIEPDIINNNYIITPVDINPPYAPIDVPTVMPNIDNPTIFLQLSCRGRIIDSFNTDCSSCSTSTMWTLKDSLNNTIAAGTLSGGLDVQYLSPDTYTVSFDCVDLPDITYNVQY